MSNYASLFVMVVLLFLFVVCVNNIFFGEFHADSFCDGEVSWANPSWFSCGGKVDYGDGMSNYYELGSIPPFTIQNYGQRYESIVRLGKRWGGVK